MVKAGKALPESKLLPWGRPDGAGQRQMKLHYRCSIHGCDRWAWGGGHFWIHTSSGVNAGSCRWQDIVGQESSNQVIGKWQQVCGPECNTCNHQHARNWQAFRMREQAILVEAGQNHAAVTAKMEALGPPGQLNTGLPPFLLPNALHPARHSCAVDHRVITGYQASRVYKIQADRYREGDAFGIHTNCAKEYVCVPA